MAELGGPRVYSCYKCRNQVCFHDDIISKSFQYPDDWEWRVRVKAVDDRLTLSKFVGSTVIYVLLQSLSIHGRNGRAFLFSHAMNVEVGPKEDRALMTGMHTVADISCGDCGQVLGWKYLRAYEPSQKYKEGKFIFEKAKIVKDDWE